MHVTDREKQIEMCIVYVCKGTVQCSKMFEEGTTIAIAIDVASYMYAGTAKAVGCCFWPPDAPLDYGVCE